MPGKKFKRLLARLNEVYAEGNFSGQSFFLEIVFLLNQCFQRCSFSLLSQNSTGYHIVTAVLQQRAYILEAPSELRRLCCTLLE